MGRAKYFNETNKRRVALQCIRLLRGGQTLRQVAETFGVAHTTINRLLTETCPLTYRRIREEQDYWKQYTGSRNNQDYEELIGQTMGSWSVKELLGYRTYDGDFTLYYADDSRIQSDPHKYLLCECTCGRQTHVKVHNLRHGKSPHCRGCTARESASVKSATAKQIIDCLVEKRGRFLACEIEKLKDAPTFTRRQQYLNQLLCWCIDTSLREDVLVNGNKLTVVLRNQEVLEMKNIHIHTVLDTYYVQPRCGITSAVFVNPEVVFEIREARPEQEWIGSVW